jgi:pilus assembly protein CpaC
MSIAPSQQVMLRVRFLEVARSASREIGVNWFGANNAGNRGFNTGIGVARPSGRPAVTGVDAGGNPVTGAGLPLFGAFGTLLSGASPFGVAIANLTAAGQSLDVYQDIRLRDVLLHLAQKVDPAGKVAAILASQLARGGQGCSGGILK